MELYVFMAHEKHWIAEDVTVYVPAGHATQKATDAAPTAVPKNPSGHLVHDVVWVNSLYDPLGHNVKNDNPLLGQ